MAADYVSINGRELCVLPYDASCLLLHGWYARYDTCQVMLKFHDINRMNAHLSPHVSF